MNTPIIETEVVATYTDKGVTYEIDHLGIANPAQNGEYAVYKIGADGSEEQVAEFATQASWFKPELAAQIPAPDIDLLIEMAKETVADNE